LSPTVTSKSCSLCGKPLAVWTEAGDRYPYCGARFKYVNTIPPPRPNAPGTATGSHHPLDLLEDALRYWTWEKVAWVAATIFLLALFFRAWQPSLLIVMSLPWVIVIGRVAKKSPEQRRWPDNLIVIGSGLLIGESFFKVILTWTSGAYYDEQIIHTSYPMISALFGCALAIFALAYYAGSLAPAVVGGAWSWPGITAHLRNMLSTGFSALFSSSYPSPEPTLAEYSYDIERRKARLVMVALLLLMVCACPLSITLLGLDGGLYTFFAMTAQIIPWALIVFSSVSRAYSSRAWPEHLQAGGYFCFILLEVGGISLIKALNGGLSLTDSWHSFYLFCESFLLILFAVGFFASTYSGEQHQNEQPYGSSQDK